MTSLDVLIVILYVTFAVYVIYRARQSLLAQKAANRAKASAGLVIVKPEQKALDEALERQLGPIALQNAVKIKVNGGIAFEDTVELLSLTIDNQSTTYAVYVNWKESWLTNARSQSRSIARLTPNEGASQSTSMIPPERTLKESFTVMTSEGAQPLPETMVLHPMRQAGKKDPKSSVLLSLSVQLRAVSQYNQNHLLALSCPINFAIPNEEELQAWQSMMKRGSAKVG